MDLANAVALSGNYELIGAPGKDAAYLFDNGVISFKYSAREAALLAIRWR